jgi:hypothetical protein
LWLYGSAAKPKILLSGKPHFVGCRICFSFQKGYIAIEAIDEQEGESQEENQDYNI